MEKLDLQDAPPEHASGVSRPEERPDGDALLVEHVRVAFEAGNVFCDCGPDQEAHMLGVPDLSGLPPSGIPEKDRPVME